MFEQAVQQIPIRHDIFSYLIGFGAGYGLNLAVVILLKGKNNSQANLLLAALLLCISLVLGDLFLGYTGLMKYVVHLNDSTESLVLLLFPLVYLILQAVVDRREIRLRTHYPHFLIPLGYFLYECLYFIQSKEVKLNAHIGAFHDGKIDYLPTEWSIDPKWMWLKEEFRLLIYLMAIIYLVLGFRLIRRLVQEGQLSLFKPQGKSKLVYARSLILITLVFVFAVLLVYFNYETDAGDHYLGVLLTYGIFAIGFFLLGESRIFENSWLADKYETSGLKADKRAVLEKVRQYLAVNSYYLEPDCSLQGLSERLDVPANYISQSVNTGLGQNFNEFINTYRIETARERLLDPAYRHLNIEGIGNSVGFNSKSAFYAAFKKHTEMTPNQYVRMNRAT